jgi:hypothetical protein
MPESSLLTQVKESNAVIFVGGDAYTIHLSYHRMTGFAGYVVGLKFSDGTGSMDSSKVRQIDGLQTGRVIAQKAVQMLLPELSETSFLGFYLLTEGLEVRGPRAVAAKKRLYNAQAIAIHKQVKHRLPVLARLEVDGGAG